MMQARSWPTRPLGSRGSDTPPIQMSMLLGVPYCAISFCASSRFFSTVPSSPTVLGCGSPQKRLQALYPALSQRTDSCKWTPLLPGRKSTRKGREKLHRCSKAHLTTQGHKQDGSLKDWLRSKWIARPLQTSYSFPLSLLLWQALYCHKSCQIQAWKLHVVP